MIVLCLVMSLRFISVGRCTEIMCVYGVLKILTRWCNMKGLPQRSMFFCAMSTRKVFREDTVTGTSYLEMLQTWLFPRLQDEPEDFIMQQVGVPPHFRLDVRRWLNDVLPHRWIGRRAHEDLMFCPWPARSPDLTPCDYFLWGYVKDKVLCHHNP